MSLPTPRPSLTANEVALERRRTRARQYRLKTLMMAVVMAAVSFGFLRLPGAAQMVVGLLGLAGAVLGLFAGLMALGWLGFAFFALFDRLMGRPAAPARKSGPVDDWWV